MPRYGAGLAIQRVTKLTPQDYVERQVERSHVAVRGVFAVVRRINGCEEAGALKALDAGGFGFQRLKNFDGALWKRLRIEAAEQRISVGELPIWGSDISADAVADLYSAVVGNFCRTSLALDYDGNCKVDLPDFAIFAAEWLKCGLYPACP